MTLKTATPLRAAQSRLLSFRVMQFLLLFLGIGIAFSFCSIYSIRHLRVNDVVPYVEFRVQAVRPCPPREANPNALGKWIRPPSSLLHPMNDTQLFWRASFVPQIEHYPFNRTPKIAFLFLTRGPLPLAPLWERFFKGHKELYSIYIHSMPSYTADFPPSSVFHGRQIPSQVAEWGTISMCDTERRLLANALLDVSNEWFALLSEACIPLYNFTTIYRYISLSQHSFMDAFDDPGPYGRGRYDDNMAPEVNITDWRNGSQWFQVNRKLAVDIVKDSTFYPKLERFCRPACYVEEHYFPTMLSIKSPHLLANRSLTWVDWSRGGAHPATFGMPDITEQFFNRFFAGQTCIYNNQPSSICFLFARKFAPSTLDPLLEVASKVLGL